MASANPQSVSAQADWAFCKHQLLSFSSCWHYTGCAAVDKMQHLHCFLAMRTPSTTPISSATPTSSHLLRVSRDLLASAAASRPKTSAKESWNQKWIQTKTRGRGIRQCLRLFRIRMKGILH